MKKVLLFILFLLFIPTFVNAEVKITNVEIIDSTKDLEVSKPTYEGLKLNVDIKFREVNDFVKYKLTIKNDTNKKYKLEIDNDFSKKEYIKYEYSLDNKDDNIIKKNSEKTIYLTITYAKEVVAEKYINGKYTEKNNLVIGLSNEETNPKTSVGIYVLIAIICLIVSTTLILLIKNKMNNIPVTVLLLLLLLPITIYALDHIKIEIASTIEIYPPVKELRFYSNDCGSFHRAKSKVFNYEKGMTFKDYINSNYVEEMKDEDYPMYLEKDEFPLYSAPAKLSECVEKVEFVEYHQTGMTPEQQEKYTAYQNNYDSCMIEFENQIKKVEIAETKIKPSDELLYYFDIVCE